MKRKLPKTIAVRWEECANDDPYLTVFTSAEDALESGETHRIGIYELREVKLGSLKPNFKTSNSHDR